MIVALQIAIAALLFLIVFAIVFLAGGVIGHAIALHSVNDPEMIRRRMEREFEVKE